MDARRLFRRLAELAEESSGMLSAVDPRRRGSRMRADYVKRTIAALMVEMRLNPYAVMLGVPGDGFVRECCEEALGRMRFLSDNLASTRCGCIRGRRATAVRSRCVSMMVRVVWSVSWACARRMAVGRLLCSTLPKSAQTA